MNQCGSLAGFTLTNPDVAINVYQNGVSDIHGGGSWRTSHDAFQLVALKHFGYEVGDLHLAAKASRAAASLYFQMCNWDRGNVAWFRVLSQALPVAAFFDTDDQLATLVKWFDLSIEPEYAGPNGPDLCRIYLLAANYFKDSQEDYRQLLEQLCNSKKKRSKLSAELFRAAIDGTQVDYETAMKSSLKHFKGIRRPPIDRTFPGEWVAVEQSLIHVIALREGKLVPKLPEEIQCFLITRKSLTLE